MKNTILSLGALGLLITGAVTPIFDGTTAEMSPVDYFTLVEMYRQEITPDRPLIVNDPNSNMDIIKAANQRLLQKATTSSVTVGGVMYTFGEYSVRRQDLITKSETPKQESLLEIITK